MRHFLLFCVILAAIFLLPYALQAGVQPVMWLGKLLFSLIFFVIIFAVFSFAFKLLTGVDLMKKIRRLLSQR